jgi:hypothetical protein
MNIIFCPLDIEMHLINFTAINGIPVHTKYNPFWDSTSITEEVARQNNFGKILDQLPFKEIVSLQYKKQTKKVSPHVDVYPEMMTKPGEYDHIVSMEPAGYRFVIEGRLDSIEIFNGETWVNAIIPKVPCGYIINSTSAKHRIKQDNGRTTIYIRGWLDEEKHLELLEKSYNKYRQYAITQVL